mgnify:CR=1 FL=1
MHYGVAREDDQSHAILLESVEELVDGVFGAFEAVGLEILASIEFETSTTSIISIPPALHLAEFRTQLRPCERQGEQGECREVQDEFQTPRPVEASGMSGRMVSSRPKRLRRGVRAVRRPSIRRRATGGATAARGIRDMRI